MQLVVRPVLHLPKVSVVSVGQFPTEVDYGLGLKESLPSEHFVFWTGELESFFRKLPPEKKEFENKLFVLGGGSRKIENAILGGGWQPWNIHQAAAFLLRYSEEAPRVLVALWAETEVHQEHKVVVFERHHSCAVHQYDGYEEYFVAPQREQQKYRVYLSPWGDWNTVTFGASRERVV